MTLRSVSDLTNVCNTFMKALYLMTQCDTIMFALVVLQRKCVVYIFTTTAHAGVVSSVVVARAEAGGVVGAVEKAVRGAGVTSSATPVCVVSAPNSVHKSSSKARHTERKKKDNKQHALINHQF